MCGSAAPPRAFLRRGRGYAAGAGIDLSVGTVGRACDNALAECVIGLFKTGVINALGHWKTVRGT